VDRNNDVTTQIDSWLTQRGLSQEEIHHGMRILIGRDWRQISGTEVLDRLRVKGLRVSDETSMFADDLETFVRSALKLGDIYITGM
jgi:hypothetical protein